jgi:hypothetical protein
VSAAIARRPAWSGRRDSFLGVCNPQLTGNQLREKGVTKVGKRLYPKIKNPASPAMLRIVEERAVW